MRRTLIGLLAILLLALSACGPAVEHTPTPGQSPQSSPSLSPTPEPTATPTAEPSPLGIPPADVPPGDYAPWQEAYADFLTQLRQEDAAKRQQLPELPEEEGYELLATLGDYYTLYDVDQDAVPELFVQYGAGEASYHTVCYAFRDGQVSSIGEFPSGHASLFTFPGENAVLFVWGHLGTAYMDKLSVTDGRLENLGEVFSEDPAETGWEEYTAPGEVVPGAQALPTYNISPEWHSTDFPPLLLPVYEYGAAPRERAQPLEEADVRAAIGAVLWDGAVFSGVSGEGFHGDAEATTLRDYLLPGTAYPYGELPLTVAQYAWADVNGDGQTDCILRLEQREQNWNNDFYLVLSAEEDGRIYGYFFQFLQDAVVTPKGSVYFQGLDGWQSVSFYQNQCYSTSADTPLQADGLAWDAFPESGAQTP